jgi:hypothetical protein
MSTDPNNDPPWIIPVNDKNFNVRSMKTQMGLSPNAVKALASIPSLKAIMKCPNCLPLGKPSKITFDQDHNGNFRIKCNNCKSGTSAAYWLTPLIEKALQLKVPTNEINRQLLLNNSSTRKFSDIIAKARISLPSPAERKTILLNEDESIIHEDTFDEPLHFENNNARDATIIRTDRFVADLYDRIEDLFRITKNQESMIKNLENSLKETQNVNARLSMNIDNINQSMQEMKEDFERRFVSMEHKVAQKDHRIQTLEEELRKKRENQPVINQEIEERIEILEVELKKKKENHPVFKHETDERKMPVRTPSSKNTKPLTKKEAEITMELIKNKLSYASVVSKNKFAVLEEEQEEEELKVERRLQITGQMPETFKPGKLAPNARRDAESLSKWLGTPLKEVKTQGNAALQAFNQEERNTRRLKMIAIKGTRPMKLGEVRRSFANAAPNYDMRRIRNFSRGGDYLEILLEEGYLPIFARQLASEAPNSHLILDYNPFETQGDLPKEEFTTRVAKRFARILSSNTGEQVKQFYSQLAEENKVLNNVNEALKELEDTKEQETTKETTKEDKEKTTITPPRL